MRRTAENLCVFSVVLGVLFVCRVTGSEGLCADGICKNSSQLSGTQPDTPRNVQLLLPSSSAAPPISMSMLAEDHVHEHHMPDVEESSAVIPLKVDEPKARAINFTLSADSGSVNGLAPNATMAPKTAAGIVTPKKVLKDISDVNMDDEDDIYPMHLDTTEYPRYQTTNSFTSINQTGNREVCLHDGKKYMQGEKMQKACDETCVCGENGKLLCTPRCNTPFFRKGRQINDPLCTEKDVEDPCCALLVCAADTETEPLEICSYQNKTYHRGETFDEGCVNRCSCEHSGNVACKPRCPPVSTKTSDRCVDVPDPKDPCCIMVLCDVTLNDHDKDLVPTDLAIKILSAKPINETTVQLMVEAFSGNVSLSNIEISEDKQVWRSQEILPDNLISKLESGHKYYIKIGENSNMVEVVMPTSSNVSENVPLTDAAIDGKCSFKGLKYKIGEEFHDDCTAYCLCTESGVQCDKMDCPTNFGLDVLDPHCLEWETVPPNFVPRAPHCCAEKVQCKNNGSCMYEGNMYSNLEEISTNITGCHKRCYCELGKVECQEICPPVTAQPPPDLKCDPQHAKLTLLPDDECCLYWMCQTIPKGFVPDYSAAYPTPPTFNQPQEEINIVDLEALSEHVVRLVFAVPSVMVGLHGRVELRYTNQLANENPSTWESQVFAPPNDLIATPQLHFELPGLLPDTEYKIKITVLLRDLHNTPSSKIYHVRTQPAPSPPPTTLPPNIPIEPNLSVGEVNSSWVVVTWRKFTDYELQFIDGVQIRYKETNGMVYAATPLIHRAVTSYTIENLKPNSEYEIGIFFIPFPGQETELKAANMIRVWTPLKLDLYGFNVTLELTLIKSTSVELTWTGVPYPQDKYVNIYRAIYKSEFGKESLSRFKIAKRDAPAKTTVYDLKPSTVYRLWLEVYLTNGKIKTSNVKEFKTTEGVVPSLDLSAQQGKLAVSETKANQEGDYYGPLVVVSIVAAIAILGTLVLSSMLMKRHGQNKAAITTPSTTRVSQSSYDNPTYKVEIQQETMNL